MGKDGITNTGRKLSLTQMRACLPPDADPPFHIGFVRGQLQVELYIPKKQDHQKPHDRDECYFVTRGSGRFVMGDEVVPFAAGDFLFVPAGMEHRFIDFGEEMETWVLFYGPDGGEGGSACR